LRLSRFFVDFVESKREGERERGREGERERGRGNRLVVSGVFLCIFALSFLKFLSQNFCISF